VTPPKRSPILKTERLNAGHAMRVLVVDIGGTHTKLAVADTSAHLQFNSPAKMNPQELVRRVHEHTQAWAYDVIAIGYPGRVGADGRRPNRAIWEPAGSALTSRRPSTRPYGL
jgi:predicted NBD/HSP70 family sugar kinase